MAQNVPTIADQSGVFEDLQPYLAMTISGSNVTVGQLAFVSAQTIHSSALQRIAVANTVPADMQLGLFQIGIGEVGQGYTDAVTRTETSWLDNQGKLPSNQVFLAMVAAFEVRVRSSASCVDTAAYTRLVPNVAALEAIGKNLSWSTNVGDGIERTYGSIGAYGGMGSTWTPPLVVNSLHLGAQACQLGDPASRGAKLRVPLVFPPSINVDLKVRNGNQFVVEGYDADGSAPGDSLPAGAYLQIVCHLRGYLCTMPTQG